MLLTQLIGNLGRDAEVKTIKDKPVVCFSVGVKVGPDHTQWVNVNANEALAKGVAPYLKSGQGVFVHGDLKVSAYQKKDGSTGIDVTVWASKIQLVGGKRETSAEPVPARQMAPPRPAEPGADDDSVPF